MTLDFDQGFKPCWGYCIVFILRLSTQMYEWVLANLMLGVIIRWDFRLIGSCTTWSERRLFLGKVGMRGGTMVRR